MALAVTPASAETQTENIVAEARTTISLRVTPKAAQAFLPQGWSVNGSPTGPNLTAIFMDKTLQLTPDGQLLGAGANRQLVLAISAKHESTGEVRTMIVGGYSADPTGAPGAYQVYRPGEVTVRRSAQRTGGQGAPLQSSAEEHWVVKGDDGTSLNFDIAYTLGPAPALRAFEQKNYSGARPDFYRIYRGAQASETVRGQGVDHLISINLTAAGGKLGQAIDGSQQIVGATVAPYYSRKTFLP